MRKPFFSFAAVLIIATISIAAPARSARPQSQPQTPNYTIEAIRYATLPHYPLAGFEMGAPRDQSVDAAMVIWLVRGGGRTILLDSGFHRQKYMDQYHVTDFVAPDEAVKLAGVDPAQVTDIVISHAHWDHLDGIDLFPQATIWIQKAEFEYYIGAAWQPGGHHGGIEPDDVTELVRRNTQGKLHLVDGDDVEIFPGIRAYTGARHTFASQYLLVQGDPPFVLASDNCYLFDNITSHRAGATFLPSDAAANLAAQDRMLKLAGSADRIIPGHDPLQFQKFPTQGRVAKIK